MKKLLALLLAIVMVLSLAACGDNAEVEDDDEKKPSATEAKGEETEPEKEPEEKPEKTEPEETEPEETKPVKKDSDFDELMDILDEYEDLVDEAYEAAEDGDYEEYLDILDEIDTLGTDTYELYAAGNYSDDEKEILDERVEELDARLDAIEFESETSSDYEIMLELVAEYNAIVDDTIELIEAEGADAQSPEIMERTAAWQEKATAFQEDNDLTAEQQLEFASLIQEAVERLYASIG